MKISPGLGTDLIAFGVTEFEVTKNLGMPDKAYLTDSNSSRLQYHELRVELAFEPNDGNRLRWMTIHNPDAELFDRKLIGHREIEVLNFLSMQIDEEPRVEDYGALLCVTYPSYRLELQFQFGRLSCINIGIVKKPSLQSALA